MTAAGGVWLGTLVVHQNGPLSAIEPIKRTGKPQVRVSLAGYSLREHFQGKRQPAITLEDFADLAASWGFDAIEPTAYYFKDTTPNFLARLKARCTRLGLDISGGAVGNNFCVADPHALKKQIADVKAWIERYSLLGAKTIRIFAGSVPKGDTEENARRRCVEAIHECCDHAARYGVYLALENHGGITSTPHQMLALIQAINHDYFGVNLDTGNFHGENPYAELLQIAPYAIVCQVKTEIFRTQNGKRLPPEPADFKKILNILRSVNYRGYIVLEYEAAEEPMKAIPRYLQELRAAIQELAMG
ncbi:MAG: sugar phosphate isomerase/epimerase family protein [Gemmatales bacterium]|nr:sugar phosphate isomerase/epimerase family protein [Gemmatales bacterium]